MSTTVRGREWTLVAAALAAALAIGTKARAQDYAGRWTATPARESVSVESWGTACGARPGPTVSPGGGVTISQTGDHLSISGAHSWRTSGCWRRSSSLQRRSTSATSTSWRTVCATPANDPRTERGEYTLRAATPDRLEFRAVTINDWYIDDSHCRVRFVASRSYTRASTAGRPAEPAEPSPREPREPAEPAARGPACEPSAPARIEVRPRELRLAPGERRCVRARVVDASGCPLARTSVVWSLNNPEQLGGILSPDGCFSADGMEGVEDGAFVAVARAGPLSAEVPIHVQSGDLLGITATSLGPQGEDSEGDASSRPSGRGGEARGLRADVEDGDLDRSVLYAALVALTAIALVLAGIALVMWRRAETRRRVREPRLSRPVVASEPAGSIAPAPPALPGPAVPEARPDPPAARDARELAGPPATPVASEARSDALAPAAATAAPPASAEGPVVCPACQQEFDAGAGFCPFDGSKLVAAETASQRPGNVCPACQRGFDSTIKQCPHDGEELVPQPLWEATRRVSAGASEPGHADGCKICPTCACRYDVDATFCGRDGSQLVLVN